MPTRRNDFNRDFQSALASKIALQGSRARSRDADAALSTEKTRLMEGDTRSAIALRGAQAGFARERTGLLGREVESAAGLRDQQARTSRIGTNIALGEGLAELEQDRFDASNFNYEGGGLGGASALNDTGVYGDNTQPTSGVRGTYGAPFDPGRAGRREESMDVLRRLPNYAGGGLVDEPGVLNFAVGGTVPDASLTNDYELYRKAAVGAGVPALPIQEAIPRMAQIRASKRQGVLDMIAQGGTTPQGFAEGGEIDGPGTGKSDSIPAIVDGVGPAAVSDGEFHIPKHVVDYFGTKMFDGLVEKARMAGKAMQRKQAPGYACGGAVKSHGR